MQNTEPFQAIPEALIEEVSGAAEFQLLVSGDVAVTPELFATAQSRLPFHAIDRQGSDDGNPFAAHVSPSEDVSALL
jgi:hypothetical protein